MAVPSNPGWKFGYVPSPGEWNNTFAGKVDYPAPVGQGGTGGQNEYDGNYNLQQRAEVITPTAQTSALTFYGLRTDLTAIALSLPLANTCRAGDWIELLDIGNNAAANHVAIDASGSDSILSESSSVSTLLLQTNGIRCTLVTDGISTWRAVTGSGGGGTPTQPVPRQITGIAYTLQLSDAGQYLQFMDDASITVTVPASADVSFARGIVVVMEQYGLGQITVVGDTGVTVSSSNTLQSGGQYAVMQLKNGLSDSPDVWTLLGDTAITPTYLEIALNLSDVASPPAARTNLGLGTAATHPATDFEPATSVNAIDTYTANATAVLADAGSVVEMNLAGANTFTVPPNSSVAFGVKTRIDLLQLGAGQTTIVAGAGVTIRSKSGNLKLTGQYSGATLYKRATNEWVLIGDLSA